MKKFNISRNKFGIIQKHSDKPLSFPEKSVVVHLTQYRTESRFPQACLTIALVDSSDVTTQALTVMNIDSFVELKSIEYHHRLHID